MNAVIDNEPDGTNDEPDGTNDEPDGTNDIEEKIKIFMTKWIKYGERFADEMRSDPKNLDLQKCSQSASKVLKKVDNYTVQTMTRHLSLFGKDIFGPKIKGKRAIRMNVQPTAISRSKKNGGKRIGRKAIGTTRPHKDRREEKLVVPGPDGEKQVVTSLGVPKARTKAKPHSFKRAVDENRPPPRRHEKHT